MRFWVEMLQAASAAPRLLGESTPLVRKFLLSQQSERGGFKNRAGECDLYYTVFGLGGLLALDLHESGWGKLMTNALAQRIGGKAGRVLGKFSDKHQERYARLEHLARGLGDYLPALGSGEDLDLVHLSCLVRCWAALVRISAFLSKPEHKRLPKPLRDGFVTELEKYRSNDGGYHQVPGSESGTPYGSFLAAGSYEDLGVELPRSEVLVDSLLRQRRTDGAWNNVPSGRMEHGSTNATAAAVAVVNMFLARVDSLTPKWLLERAHPQGGFLAAPNAPMPDLLSTATALHTLATLGVSLAPVKQGCLDFVDSLWTNAGSFHGHWLEESLDTEYTFYGLLALGHLA